MEIIEIKEYKSLPYGENVFQEAAISPLECGLEYEILSDNDALEYLDFLNFTRVVEVLGEFFDVNTVAIAKSNMLSSVALGSSVDNAFEKAIKCDPVNLCSSTVGFSKNVTLECAKQLCAMKIRNVISVGFENEALDYLVKNTDINIIRIKSPLQEMLGFSTSGVKVTPFGYLVQEQNKSKLTKSSFKVCGKTKPTQQMAEDAIFAWKVAKYTRTNSAVIAKDLAVCAISQGYINGADAVEDAMDFACENSKDAVLAIDGFVENEEIVNAAIQGRIGLIIEAGDGAESKKIAKITDKYNIVLIATGIRNYRY